MRIASHPEGCRGREDADFYRAIGNEMANHGFRELFDEEPGIPLWTRENADNAVLSVARDRDEMPAELDNPLGVGVLLLGGRARTDHLYFFEDAISCWGADWGDKASEMRARLYETGEKTNLFVDDFGWDPPEPPVTFLEMLGLAADKWPNLDHRFTPDCIERTLVELSDVRVGFIEELCRIASEGRAEDLDLTAQSDVPWLHE